MTGLTDLGGEEGNEDGTEIKVGRSNNGIIPELAS